MRVALSRTTLSPRGFQYLSKASKQRSNSSVTALLENLRSLDTSSVCDAHKSLLASGHDDHKPQDLTLLDHRIVPMNHECSPLIMAGVARTVQLATKNDILAVFRGLDAASEGEVLVVNTCLLYTSPSPRD